MVYCYDLVAFCYDKYAFSAAREEGTYTRVCRTSALNYQLGGRGVRPGLPSAQEDGASHTQICLNRAFVPCQVFPSLLVASEDEVESRSRPL